MDEQVTFRERMSVPWWWLLLFWGALTLANRVLSVGDGWGEHALYAAWLPLFFAAFGWLTVLQVRDGRIVTGRRAGGRPLPVDDLVEVRVLTGPALREVRNRMTPSFRLHCPVWYRLGVQVITLKDSERVEHLYGVRDAAGFLDAIGVTPDQPADAYRQRGVPV